MASNFSFERSAGRQTKASTDGKSEAAPDPERLLQLLACKELLLYGFLHGSLGGVDYSTCLVGSGVNDGSSGVGGGVNHGGGSGVNLGGYFLYFGFGLLLVGAGSQEYDASDGEKLLHLSGFLF
jgi:hypothetical protein